MKRVIISVTNDLTTDQRVDKVANSLFKAGFTVLLIGRSLPCSLALSKRHYSAVRLSMFFNKGFLFYLEYNLKLFFYLISKKSDILLSNDLDTICANFFASKLKKNKLIYDSHEIFTEVPELNERPFVKFIWLLIERFFIKKIKTSYTVSDGFAEYYNQKYGICMSVISNFPLSRIVTESMKKTTQKKIIYQGAVNKDRGVHLMVEAMLYVNAKLYIVGDGDLLPQIQDHVKRLSLEGKVVFLGKLPFNDLFKITCSADLGLSFEDDTCLSYRYSLPNKIFDYISAEIPVLVSDLPEFKNIIEADSIGEVIRKRTPKDVSNQINNLLSVPKSHWVSALRSAKSKYNWQNQESKLLSFFS
ncbi:MAG: glycosyl transferase group 1 [Flavobacteriales bacterium]|nr:glycosyl transferase group 1 [Flavobacteriales bacterium]